MMKNNTLHKSISYFSYILCGLSFLLLLYISYYIVKRCNRRFRALSYKEHNHQTDSCAKFINCLTFNVGNNNSRRSPAPLRTRLELQETNTCKPTSTHKTTEIDECTTEDSQDELYCKDSKESASRRTIIEDKL